MSPKKVKYQVPDNSYWAARNPNFDYSKHAHQTKNNYSPLTEQILSEIRDEVKQLSEQRAAYIIQTQCGNRCEYYPPHGVPGFLLDSRLDPFPLSYGFNVRLRDHMISNPWTQIKLNNFYIPSGTGSFIRGFRLNSLASDMTVPLSGVYSISASIHFRVGGVGELEKVRLKHNVVVAVYATDLVFAERKPSSQYRSSIPQAKHFTVHFSTTLYLQVGQPLAIEVENESKAKMIVGEESEFSAHLIGT
ncbi:LOW QUALITY PROTEIN: adipolin-like [Convolutriloba macropyga]|uniref:LOW QUALITY PROTEIN: adipolin-like n=1 Tax=Convolutriloba macropyga TaxID=536237 RepID=UPI003F51D621